jgi:hypothetical protein
MDCSNMNKSEQIRSLESANMPVEPHSDGSNRPLLIFPVGFDGVGVAETS